jgi:hypothetical protein
VTLERSYGRRDAAIVDESGFLRCPNWNRVDRGPELGTVRDQPVDGNIPAADRSHDPMEVLCGGVAASKQGHFLAMEIRIRERDRVFDDADQHVSATMSHEFEAPFHGSLAAGGVEHEIEAGTPGECAHGFGHVTFNSNGGGAGDPLSRRRAFRAPVEHRDLGA